MKVRFIQHWQTYKPGDVIEPPGTLREWLQTSGFVEPVELKKRRGRPRKRTNNG